MKYIDADKLIVEIERQMNECIGRFGIIHKLPEYRCLKNIRSYVTSLQQEQDTALETMEEKDRIDEGFTKFIQKWQEQPEVDLEKEIRNYNVPLNDWERLTYNTIEKIAHHFYELGRTAK